MAKITKNKKIVQGLLDEYQSEIANTIDFYMSDYQIGEMTMRQLARNVAEKVHEDYEVEFTEKEILDILVDTF